MTCKDCALGQTFNNAQEGVRICGAKKSSTYGLANLQVNPCDYFQSHFEVPTPVEPEARIIEDMTKQYTKPFLTDLPIEIVQGARATILLKVLEVLTQIVEVVTDESI